MAVSKIVITGGPCGGKTTGLSYLERAMTKFGYKVVFINESATEFMLNGITPTTCVDNYEFEKNLLKLQQMNEDFYMSVCEKLPYEKVLLVCDRGIMDCKSYMTDNEFRMALINLGLNEIQMRDNYDAVFHLLTAAKGAEKYYTTQNNLARREDSLNEAIEVDDKTINAWTGHPHFRIIDNSTDFEGKMKRLVKEICIALGEPEPFEIERKFLIEMPNIDMLENLPNCRRVNITQTYLKSEKGKEIRVRKRGKDGSYIYTITEKEPITPTKRYEHERRITDIEYFTYLKDADPKVNKIEKKRYCLVYNNRYFEIDIYDFAKNHAIMEIELSSENDEFEIPNYINVIKEVTNNKSFSNYSFARHFPAEMN